MNSRTIAAAVLEHLALQENHFLPQGFDHNAQVAVVLLQLAGLGFQVVGPFFFLLAALGGRDAVALKEFEAPHVFWFGGVDFVFGRVAGGVFAGTFCGLCGGVGGGGGAFAFL